MGVPGRAAAMSRRFRTRLAPAEPSEPAACPLRVTVCGVDRLTSDVWSPPNLSLPNETRNENEESE